MLPVRPYIVQNESNLERNQYGNNFTHHMAKSIVTTQES